MTRRMGRLATSARAGLAGALALVALIGSVAVAVHLAGAALASPVPPVPTITTHPTNPSSNTGPEFEMTVPKGHDLTLWCRLDAGPTVSCTGNTDHDGDRRIQGELRYSGLDPGRHCFAVHVTEEGGHVGPATTFCWTITAPPSAFTIAGSITQRLYPGTGRTLDLVFTNPTSSPITIAPGHVTITISTTAAHCPAFPNFAVARGLAATVTIPKHSTRSLSGLGIASADWPVIAMVETHTDQSACEGAAVTLHYTGSAGP